MDNFLGARIEALAAQRGELRVLSLADERGLADEWGVSPREVQLTALARQVLPARYQRSLGTVGWEGQARLLRASVGLVGAGGLGGYVVEALARMGVGRLVVIDGDNFEEHNLNRQLLCTEANLGASKAAAAAERAAQLNGAVQVEAKHVLLTDDNAQQLLAGVDVVVDGLDSLPARFVLERATKALGVPLVHGAIAGYIAQVMTIFPEDEGLVLIYGRGKTPERGVETVYGNPAATPMLCAACQVQETIKVLLGVGEPLRNRLLVLDGEYATANVIRLT